MKNIFKGLGLGLIALALVVGVGAGVAGATLTMSTTALNTAADDAFILGAANTTGSITLGSATHTGATSIASGATTTDAIELGTSTVTTGNAIDVALAGLTQGKGIDMSDLAALTTGTALHIDATGITQTTGKLVYLDSAGTVLESTARLLLSDHTGITTTSGVLNEFKSAANDETEIVKITASSTLTAGKALDVAVGSMDTGTGILITPTGITTGKAINVTDLAALTTGIGLNMTSAATVITGAGRLLYVNHTGATGNSAILNEFASAANDETTILKVTASAANALGTALAISSATTTGYGQTITANSLTTGNALLVTSSSASTSGSTSVQPIKMVSTMTGVGGVGGRALFEMDTEVVLGGWANALKGYTDFGTAGSVTGLGSAVVAEMRLPAKTLTAGTYAPLELELVLQASGTTGGTPVSLIYGQASGNSTSLADFNATGSLMNFAGLTDATGNIFETESDASVAATHSLRIMINGTAYYIPLNTSTSFD